MGHKFIEKEGCWYVYYAKRNPKNGRVVNLRRKVESKAKVVQVERELILEVERKINEMNLPKWPDMILGFLKSCHEKGLSLKTIYNAETCLKAATLPRWEDRLPNEITTQEVRDLILVEYKSFSTSHQKAILKHIRLVFNWAVEQGMLVRNPAPSLAFRTGDKIKKVLTEEQTRTLLHKAKELDWEWYPHYAMAIYTGMRNGELYALTWDKVNLHDRKILVDCSWNNKDGFKSTKSGDDRIVEIAPNLVPVMQELKLQSGRSNFVLPRNARWDKGDQARELRMFLTGIGLPPVRFHDLRATWATLMLSKGVEPVKVMVMGGWRDMKTMMIYIRKAGIDIKGITDRLDLHDHFHVMGRVLNFADRQSK